MPPTLFTPPYSLSRRRLLHGASAAGLSLAAAPSFGAQENAAQDWDIIIVGGGTAGIPAGIFAAQRNAKVLIIEASQQLGGTLFLSTGQMSAAGTQLQAAKGIADTPQMHFDDVMRISKKTADPALVKLAVFNAAETFDWLTANGLQPLPEHPVLGLAHEPYSAKRYAWGEEGGISILDVIEPLALAEVNAGRLVIQRATRVRELLQRDGAVVGVRAEDEHGTMADFRAKSVLMTSGGYAMNPKVFYDLSGVKAYGAASYPYSQGDGHLMILGVGGYTRGKENYICGSPRVLAEATDPSPPYVRVSMYPERRPPWEIQVNVHGKRYVAEDNPSVDQRELALVAQPDFRTWLIFDQAIFDAAPPVVDGWDRARMAEEFNAHPMFKKAGTLAELAALAGVDEAGLQATVARYNQAVASGKDSEFQRQHMPLPIAQAPFYSIRQNGISVTSTVGVGVDDKLRVTRKDGRVIPGLYAAGEILGSGQLMGKSAVGGMMVTPALTFGRLLGQSMVPIKS
ncbi:MAG: FAD-binding protein [Rhodobacteraceae bacterium]|nr:FAD-binding protein [Paracoccaceae bacterium]